MKNKREMEPGAPKKIKRILIVDDDLFWRLSISQKMIKLDKSLVIDMSGSFDDALDLIRSHEPYDLIISDFYLGTNETGLDLFDHHQYVENKSEFILTSGSEANHHNHILNGGPRFVPKMNLCDLIERMQMITAHN